MSGRFVFVDPPSPPGFVSFKQSHGGLGEFCKASRLRVPPLDLFHSASLLLENGFDAQIVDSVLSEHAPEQSAAEILHRRPSCVVFRAGAFSLPHDLETAALVRRGFDGPIVFYGPAMAFEPETALASGAVDVVVTGEAAPAFLEAARSGWGGRRLVEAPVIENLDLLPTPRWDLVDYAKYTYLTAQTSWGCPFGCGYCPYPVTQGARWRVRSVGSVVREFEALRARYGARFVMLCDPEFTLNRRRTVELCDALIEAGAPLAWGCETRLDTLDDDLISLMARAGCLRVTFGVESLSPEALGLMARPEFGKDMIRGKVALLKKHGLLTYALYIIGLPGETRESTLELGDFALELGTDGASFSMAAPFRGTALERLARLKGWITAADPRRLTSSVPSMRNERMSPEEIQELYLHIKHRWKQRKNAPSPLLSPA